MDDSLHARAIACGINDGPDMQRFIRLITGLARKFKADLESVSTVALRVACAGMVTSVAVKRLQDQGIPFVRFIAEEAGSDPCGVPAMVSAGDVNLDIFLRSIERQLSAATD